MKNKELELGDFVLDKGKNKTGQIVVIDSDTVYVQFPKEKHLTEYLKTSTDIIFVGTEQRKYFRLKNFLKKKNESK